MGGLRILWRGSRLTLHILVGLLLTPLVSRHDPSTGALRAAPGVVTWWHGRLAHILQLRITTSGPAPQPPALIIANHVSWLDIVLIGHLTPTCFLSKDEVRTWPIIGWLATRSGTLFIKRGSGEASVVRECIRERLQRNGLLALFPEGTTTDGRDVRPFFSRLFGAAIESNSPIIPASIRYHIDGEHDDVAPYIDEQTIGDNLLQMMRRKHNEVHVHFGTPIAPHEHDRKTLAELTRKAVLSGLEQPHHASAQQAASQRKAQS